jgi:hypothetical protein
MSVYLEATEAASTSDTAAAYCCIDVLRTCLRKSPGATKPSRGSMPNDTSLLRYMKASLSRLQGYATLYQWEGYVDGDVFVIKKLPAK